jgi:AcrR family transcriptional regulator
MLEAAIGEFAARGFHATSTGTIARRVGVSQPYLYALFSDKRTLFLACYDRVIEGIRDALQDAAGGEGLEERLGRAYAELVASRPERILFQLQAYAAAGDPEIREHVRAGFMWLVDESVRLHRVPREVVLGYVARALLQNATSALGVPESYRLPL